MKKKHNAVSASGDGEPPIVVRGRRRSHLPIVIPVPRTGLDAEALELEKAERMLKGTTSQGREIVRKLVIKAREKLFPQPMTCDSAERPLEPQLPTSQLDEARSVSGRGPLAEASQINGSAPKIPETKIADAPIQPQAKPVPPTDKSRAGSEVLSPTQSIAPARPRPPVRGCSMAEARRLSLA